MQRKPEAAGGLDTLYEVEAPEGIHLRLRPAGLVARMMAYAIDLGIRLGIYLMALVFLRAAGNFGWGLASLLLFALEWLYPIAFEIAAFGATPGKHVAGVRVCMDNGLPVTLSASVTRNLLRFADFLPFFYAFGLLAVLTRPDFKRWGDLAAGTLVVYRDPPSTNAPLPRVPVREPVRPLNLEEQGAILNWASRASTLTPERLEELAEMARPIFDGHLPESGCEPGPREEASGAAVGPATLQLLGVAQALVGQGAGVSVSRSGPTGARA